MTELSLPLGLRLSVRLAQPVDSQQAAVGDAISAIVESSTEYKGALVVPKGAVLRGRIRRLERHSIPARHYIVGLEFTELEFPGHHARFFGEMNHVDPVANLKWFLASSSTKTPGRRELGSPLGTMTYSHTETYRIAQVPGVSTFFIEATQFRLPEGLRMTWRTVGVAK